MRTTTVSAYEKYLYMSYVPKPAEVDLDWLNCDFECDFGQAAGIEQWWVKEGVKALKQTMAEEIDRSDHRAAHIVPLSGGLDSRAILGGLLENLPRSQIIAATYGIPGAWDFEIAKRITRKFGLQHEVFDLTQEKWEPEHLVKAATRLTLPVSVHQSYIRQKITNHFGKDCVYWSGFMGDAFGGSYLPKIPSIDKREAVKRCVNTAHTPNYKDQSFQDAIIEEVLDECTWDRLDNKKFSLDQQIDMGLRQNFLHRPLVLINGFHFKTPFLNRTWGTFMVNVPYKWLLGFHLYKRIIIESYRDLSKLPSTTNAGLPLTIPPKMVHLGTLLARIRPYVNRRDQFRSHPRTNYINFTEALRHKGNFQDSVYTTLQELKKRQIFDNKEIDQWWCDHLNRKTNYTKLLMNLSSLELLMKVGLI